MTWVKGMPPKFMQDNGLHQYSGQWMPEMDRCWEDYERGYSVCSRMIYTKQWGNVEHVTITRHRKDEDLLPAMGGQAAI